MRQLVPFSFSAQTIHFFFCTDVRPPFKYEEKCGIFNLNFSMEIKTGAGTCVRVVVSFFSLPSLSQPGLKNLSARQRDLFGGQHAALMLVRPDAGLFRAISELLCKVYTFTGNFSASLGWSGRVMNRQSSRQAGKARELGLLLPCKREAAKERQQGQNR